MRNLILLLVSVLWVSAPTRADEGVWLSTGPLAAIRADATSTLLPSGKVLVAGGSGAGGEIFDSAELYDPATGSWAPTGNLKVSRRQHTATLLPTGEVLVAGGVNGSAVETAELYDPETGTWRFTKQDLTGARFQHTATLLPSGIVLVAGGFGRSSEALDTTELFDPKTAEWSSSLGSSMGRARGQHTATLLRSGQVLIAGGRDKDALVAEAQIYTIGNGWTSAGTLSQPRICHSATLLPSGKVLVVGGARGLKCGSDGFPFTEAKAIELFDPLEQRWSRSMNDMLASRALHSAVLLASGRVLVAGGIPPSIKPGRLTHGSEIYDGVTESWQSGDPLTGPGGNLRLRHTATLLPSGQVLLAGGDQLRSAELYAPPPASRLSTRARAIPDGFVTAPTATLLPSGKVLLVGGSREGAAVEKAWIYDPSTREWRKTGSLRSARVAHTATLLSNGKVLVVGGRSKLDLAKGTPLSNSEIYDLTTGAWSPAGHLAMARSGHTATLLPSGKVLIAGGADPSPLDSAEIYDPEPDSGGWSSTGPLLGARVEHAAALLATGQVLVAGGFNDKPLGSAELYDPESGTWSPTGSLLISRKQASATLLPSGRVLLAGGFSATRLAATEIYDPEAEDWLSRPSLKNPRTEHVALLLPSGAVLFAGGWNGTNIQQDTVEIYDPTLGPLGVGRIPQMRRSPAAALLPSGKVLLVGGTSTSGGDLNTAEILDLDPAVSTHRPKITSISGPINFGEVFRLDGQFGSELEASSGGSNNTAVNYPLVQLTSLEGSQQSWLVPKPQSSFWAQSLSIGDLPATLNPGWHRLTVFTSGQAGASWLVPVGCGLAITRHPVEQAVALGETATFSIETQGGRTYQWQRNEADIPGATSLSYTTPPATPDDSGATYRVKVRGGCKSEISRPAELKIEDGNDPVAGVLSPSGGEYWPLSTSGNPPSVQQVTWSMSDKIRICKVEVSLEYSTDGGARYQSVQPPQPSSGLPSTFGDDFSCPPPGVTIKSTAYTVPERPPSRVTRSLYRIRLEVTNQAQRSTMTHSDPFFIVQPGSDIVHTLILANVPRMQDKMSISSQQAEDLSSQLQELAGDVQGLVVNLDDVPDIRSFYADWDADTGNPDKVNRLLFGCHETACAPEQVGIHDKVLELKKLYADMKYLVLVGDDRIIPFARIADRTSLLTERIYNEEAGLASTTVGKALNENQILSDDPLAFLGPVDPNDLAGTREDRIFLPDLAVGRLVEKPTEIISTISTFRAGPVLKLNLTEHKVLVTGYDFLLDSGRMIRDRWKSRLASDDDHLAPVNGTLLTEDWGVNSAAERADVLGSHLCGNESDPYAISFLNGHAAHDLEGVPGSGPFDIQGLSAASLYGNLCDPEKPLSLNGGVVFAVGCHGGLPVAGSSADNRTLDLPQTFLARGAVVYVANTGFGWGLRHGIGYAERLAQILSEEMSAGGVVVTGEAVKRTKLRYFLETPRLDPYDEKSLLQWTFFGLPMYAVDTGIPKPPPSPGEILFAELSLSRAERPAIERIGAVVVERRRLKTSPETATQVAEAEVVPKLPYGFSSQPVGFIFSGEGVYRKWGASGREIHAPGCPSDEPDGCYYTLNGLATGMSDQPIQPYFIYYSLLPGTSQHGLLWLGGTFVEEPGWKPVIAELISNGELGSNHGSLPRHDTPKPRRRRRILGGDPASCPASDTEMNSLVFSTGEALGDNHSIQRRFTRVDLEALYFNNPIDPGENCDSSGPTFLSPGDPYHAVEGKVISWDVPVEDSSGVLRVVIVYNEAGQHQWVPLDLTLDKNSNRWHGNLELHAKLNYVVQAVDRRGNVSWLDYAPLVLPESGVSPEVPQVVEVKPD